MQDGHICAICDDGGNLIRYAYSLSSYPISFSYICLVVLFFPFVIVLLFKALNR